MARVWSVEQIRRNICGDACAETDVADMIEILPATMPKIIRKITASCRLPVIAGGLITDKEDILLALQNGATAVSSTTRAVWSL